MSERNLGDERTTIVADGRELRIERVFAAPRELVWAAMTSPEHIPHWWGPHGTTAAAEIDLRPGGRWWIGPRPGEQGVGFHGEFIEVEPPGRLVRTVAPDQAPDGGEPAVETVALTDLDGSTKMLYHARFPSAEVLDFALAQGMTKGVTEQFDRLADLLARPL